MENQQEPQLDVPQKMPLQEAPEESVVTDNAVAPIQDVPLEQPLPPNEDIPDQVVPDTDSVPLVETPVEEQISDEISLATYEQTPMVEDLSPDNGPY